MPDPQPQYFPVTWPFLLLLIVLFFLLVGMIAGRILRYASVRMGVGAPVASIGGAGTFDGIFVTALLAVILASFATRQDVRSSSS